MQNLDDLDATDADEVDVDPTGGADIDFGAGSSSDEESSDED